MSWNLEEAISYYKRQGAPADQTALISLLGEVQQENGGSIPHSALLKIAEACGVKESFLLAIIRRIPRLRLSGRHTLEVCSGVNCGRRAALAAFIEKTWGTNPREFALTYVPCMRLCGKGPNIRWDGKLYHNADEALLKQLVGEGSK